MDKSKKGFGGIQFNTALKPDKDDDKMISGFGGIQFNTALKQVRKSAQTNGVLEAFNSTQL